MPRIPSLIPILLYVAGLVGDAVSTILAVTHGAIELNPIGPIGVVVVNVGWIPVSIIMYERMLRTLEDPYRALVMMLVAVIGAAKLAATLWNLHLALLLM